MIPSTVFFLPWAAKYVLRTPELSRVFAVATASTIDSAAAPHIAHAARLAPNEWHRAASLARCKKPMPRRSDSDANNSLRRIVSSRIGINAPETIHDLPILVTAKPLLSAFPLLGTPGRSTPRRHNSHAASKKNGVNSRLSG